MPLGLGNNLIRSGGAGNPDKLALDLQFATDKTLTARKGPTPVLTRANATATFIGSDGLIQTAAIDQARFDHDPDTLVCKGLLLEEQRTNLCLRSEEFNNAVWQGAVQTPTISTNFAVSPNGTQNAERLQWTVVNGRLQQTFSPSVLTNYTFSVWLKSNTGSNQIVELFLYFGVGGTNYGEAKTVTPNWQRFTVTASSTVVAAGAVFQIRSSQSTTDILAWGAQTEAGAYATSYIPTTTGSAIRSADALSITGGDFALVYNESEHTLFCEASPRAHPGNAAYLSFDNGTSAERSSLAAFGVASSVSCYVFDQGVSQANISTGTTMNQNNKLAAAMKANSFQLAVNGSLGTEDTSGTMPTATTLKIGRDYNSSTVTGTYKQIKVYKKRLANAKLQTLTT